MAHWVAVVPNKLVMACGTKTQAIAEIASLFTGNSKYLASRVADQLKQSDGISIAYGRESEEIAKVFLCNCGSKRKHSK